MSSDFNVEVEAYYINKVKESKKSIFDQPIRINTESGDPKLNIDLRLSKSTANSISAKHILITISTSDISRSFSDLRFSILVLF